MIKFIDPWYFLIALCIGMFMAYITTPTPDIIIKYPTPENAGKIVYRDSADVCYKYNATEVACPKDKSLIKQLPNQHTNINTKEKESWFTSMMNKTKL